MDVIYELLSNATNANVYEFFLCEKKTNAFFSFLLSQKTTSGFLQ